MEHVLVLGMARSGIALAKLLLDHGRRVTLADEAAESRGAAAEEPDRRAHVRIGPFVELDTADVDRVVLSPGVAASHPFVRRCLDEGLPLEGELETAARFARAPCLAVTGTNGKSTVSHLIASVAEAGGMPTRLAGNVGTPFSSVVEELGDEGRFVLEVSSFQLETIREFHPDVAVFLNVTPDHLDRYEGMDDYAAAKERMTMNMTASDAVVFNAGDPRCRAIAERARARGVAFHAGEPLEKGVFLEQGAVRLRAEGRNEEVLRVDELRIAGLHNVENTLAAVAAGALLGVTAPAMAGALRAFPGLPHRMEHVGRVDGADWYNDSKATNVDAVIMGLRGAARPVVLIAGGRAKEPDFERLLPHLEKVRAVVLIGEAAERMEQVLLPVVRVERGADLPDASERARRLARPGDVVVLSPACASFDMFRDFEDRGDQFREIVRGWLGREPDAQRTGGRG